MELHFTRDYATADERRAVDRIVGSSKAREATASDNGLSGENAALAPANRRHLLLPALHALQGRMGCLSAGGLNYLATQLDIPPAEIYSVASFYDLFRLEPNPPVSVYVCDDIACKTKGADELCAHLESTLGKAGDACLGGRATWRRAPCLGLCEQGPAALLRAAGSVPREETVTRVTSQTLIASVESFVEGGEVPADLRARLRDYVPQSGDPQLRLLRRVGSVDPTSIRDYQRTGGYEALRRGMEMGPEAVVREVIESRLLGRGGAAFPTGKKWEALLRQRTPDCTHYVVCNADESEPGTFKDRVLMTGDPFAVVEGLTIAGFATGAKTGYIYVRGEYPDAFQRMSGAVAAAREHHFLGERILGGDFSFDVEIRRGAGAYICGEETALFNSIEGYRGEPRNKPPFPTQSGLFRRPTVVNNVETLVNIPEVISQGGAAYARIGTQQSTGYRLFCLSGHVKKPGTYEVPFGMTLRELIELAGGVGGNGRLQSVLLGGAAGSFVSTKELDTPLTFEGVRAIGASLGSGVVMLFDDSVDLKAILARIARFFHHESCGQCVPCRVGTIRQEEILERLATNKPNGSVTDEIALLKEVAQAMRDASICGLGQTAPNALLSAVERWSLFS